MNVHVLTVMLSIVIIVEAFSQRLDAGAASPMVMVATVPALLYLMSQFLYVILNFERIKLQLFRKRIKGQ